MARQRFDMPTGDLVSYDPEEIGGGRKVVNVPNTDGSGGRLVSGGNEGWDETNRYRGLGDAAAKRQAYQVNFGKAMGDEAQGIEARNAQQDAANQLRGAAAGDAPSQAAILGNQAAGQSLQAQMAAGANARGLGAAAAQMQAANAAPSQQLGSLGQFSGMRGAEMQHSLGAYGAAGGTMRTGDYAQQGMAQQRAEAQGQSEFSQRQLNQQGQMGYEQMGINNQQAQSDADIRRDQMQAQANADESAAHDARNARNMQTFVAGASAVGSLGGSDERMKHEVVPLYDPSDSVERHWDRDVSKVQPDVTSGASLTGPAPKYSSGRESAGEAKAKSRGGMGDAASRKMTMAELEKYGRELQGNVRAQSEAQLTPDESRLRRMGEDMRDTQRAGNEAQLQAGPSVVDHERDPMGHALETGLKPFEYEYKPGFREQERQVPGEKNVGPMAQDMASNPITGSAVKQDPRTGMLMIDMPKATKLNSAGIGYLAAKQRKLEEELARLKGEA